MTQQPKTSLMGLEMNQSSLQDLVARSLDVIKTRSTQERFFCANPHSLAVMTSDGEFKQALQDATMLVADGIGISLTGKILRRKVGPRIAGNDYYQAISVALNQAEAELGRKARVFFFGSSAQVLGLIKERFEREYPNIELCGVLSPPFGDWSVEENKQMIAEINAARPDVVWVGLTAPKQEKWINANYQQLDAPVFGAIGAVFDFYAGTYTRAPEIFCKLGLEWLFRLLKEPKRMWRRTFVSVPIFLLAVLKYHLFGARV